MNKVTLYITGLALLLLLSLAYSNHFDNGFYFDDSHTIKNNLAIRDISNIPLFFKDGRTASTLPANQAYRPMVATLNAIDYWLAGNELNPVYFHLSIFFWYIIQLLLLFLFFRMIFNITYPHKWNDWIALFSTAFYGFHTANAETINYIISRSDGFSTLCIIGTLVLYQNRKMRSWFLYLIPLILGIYTKQTGVVAVPLLLLYILLFEEDFHFKSGTEFKAYLTKIFNATKKGLVATVVGLGLFLFNQMYMTPKSNGVYDKSTSKIEYLITQFYVMTHYLANFIFPSQLSADPDIKIISNFFDHRVLLGFVILIAMLYIAFRALKHKHFRGITYGILWYYLALAPTSTILPRYQIANDHRTFFPYIGLVLALGTILGYWAKKNDYKIERSSKLKIGIFGLFGLVILGHSIGIHTRNNVWGSSKTLWKDVTIKSPKNERGLMNYGLTCMKEAKYDSALYYFNKGLEENPRYPTLHVNLAALKQRNEGTDKEVEEHYKKALKHGDILPASYLFYGNWLRKKDRVDEAKKILQRGLRVAPDHPKLQKAFERAEKAHNATSEDKIAELLEEVAEEPSAGNYLNLGLAYYQAGQYLKCIEYCNMVLEINPLSKYAHNNICTASNKLKRWDDGIAACKKAIEIDPEFQLAKNNLKWAVDAKKKEEKN